MIRILFVCVGNICRSPAGAAILRHLAKEQSVHVEVDSCGVSSWNIGDSPDERMAKALQSRGIAVEGRAKLFDRAYLDEFDYILASDPGVLQEIRRHVETNAQKSKTHLICDFSESYKGQAIPDPYTQGAGFHERVLDMLEESCQGLLNQIQKKPKG